MGVGASVRPIALGAGGQPWAVLPNDRHVLRSLLADTVEKLICCGGWSLVIHSTEDESGGSVDDGRSAGDTVEPILSVSVGRPGSRRSHAACHRPLPRPRWVEAASGAVLQHDGPALD